MSGLDKEQIDKFRDAAREVGCSDDEAEFELRLRKIAQAPPTQPKAKPKKTKTPAK